jgi:hypothetical protein
MINMDLTMMKHALKMSKRESWGWGTVCDEKEQADVQSEESN